MTKVSFDFDSTLDIKAVQLYARELVRSDIEVWICTSRQHADKAPNKEWNDDLFLVADKVGIKTEHIIFTNLNLKSEFFNAKGFLWHLDDDSIEIDFINNETSCKGVLRGRKNDWKKECNELLSKI